MASDLTDAQLLDIRRNYLGDEWNSNSPLPGGLSTANVALMKNFFTDNQLKAIDVSVQRRWGIDLDDLEVTTVSDRLAAGDDQATADASGVSERREARYHLIAGIALDRMANSPRHAATQTIKGADIEANRDAMRRDAIQHFAWVGITIELDR